MITKEKRCLGECVNCGSGNIEYKAMEVDDNYIYYPIDCNECGVESKEYYSLVYDMSTARVEPEKLKRDE